MSEGVWKKAVFERYPDLVADLEVSDKGEVRKLTTKKLYKTQTKDNQVLVERIGRRIFLRFLVLETFDRAMKEDETVAFKDGNRNNVSLANLYYVKKETNILPVPSKKDEVISCLSRIQQDMKRLEALIRE